MSNLFDNPPGPKPLAPAPPVPPPAPVVPIRRHGPTLRREVDAPNGSPRFWVGRVRADGAVGEMLFSREDLVVLRTLIDRELGR